MKVAIVYNCIFIYDENYYTVKEPCYDEKLCLYYGLKN
ncbi:hypothetical protein SAMN05444407_10349 [Chryseobacterium contaminans]|uniref:Uncharacterized protein n=1 Tax=Chryseobacterium contaminans TaxID=1423959 RepID=A0A1M6Z1H5_9FLAO|nr:hypothetical protein SAMN05444407_10349 [Chryseobacterium contaminans]